MTYRKNPTGKSLIPVLLAGACLMLAGLGSAAAAEPIRIGVMAPVALHNGPSFMRGAALAVNQINADGGIDGRPIKLFKYDDKVSASDGVRAFQRAVQQDHVVAMTGLFVSEVALSVERWSARLKTPLVVTGAASPKITQAVRDNYDQYKYVFAHFMNSRQMARGTCNFAKDVLVDKLHYNTAVLFSEDAAWTQPLQAEYEKCMPEAGLQILDRIRFSVDTGDFTPLYSRIKRKDPDVVVSAIAHTGTKPVVQWRQQQVPALMFGPNGQGSSSDFWKVTNGDASGIIVGGTISANGAALTSKTPAFYKQYVDAYGEVPAFSGYTTYDSIYTLKDAIERAGSTDADAMVSALEKTDREGASGRIKFQGKNDTYPHALVYTPHVTGGVYFQWQNDKQIVLWPENIAQGELQFPDFVPKPQ